ncbi:MAG: alpha/beta fold hydrolase [Bradymonadaceae bacterium]
METTTQAPAERSFEVPGHLYPFDANFFDIGGDVRMHYVDEGQGLPVVMVHGNPTWSFYYRRLISAVSKTHRVIVPDHIGCGFSDKPGDDLYQYTLKSRVDDLERLLDSLEITEKVTLVLHDWGGMIGMAYASRYPERIHRIVLLNTAAFRLPVTKPLPWTLRLARDTGLGALLVNQLNAFSRGAARFCVTQKMSAEVAAAYTAPYDTPENRIATLRFVQDIPLSPGDPAFEIVQGVEENLGQFDDRPVLICWGGKDFVFDRHFLARWKEILPSAKVVEFPDAGHYVLEDKADEIVPLVESFLAEHPIVEEV